MIDPRPFSAFIIAATLLILMPGPIVSLVVANTVALGPRAGFTTVAGAAVGNALLIAIGAAGLTAALTLLVPLFEWIRWAGALYLIWLGLKSWRAAFTCVASNPLCSDAAASGAFWHGLVVAVTNPKTILFFAAFFPQFIEPSLPVGRQLAAMSVTMLAIAIASDSLYAGLAVRLRPWLLARSRIQRGITGTLLVTTGVGLVVARRR